MNQRRKFSQALPCQLVRKNDKSIVVPVVEDGRERMKGSIGQIELARVRSEKSEIEFDRGVGSDRRARVILEA